MINEVTNKTIVRTQAIDPLSQQLQDLLNEYENAVSSGDIAAELKVLKKIQSFLNTNEGLIMEQCFDNGWNPQHMGLKNWEKDWEAHYGSFFIDLNAMINEAIADPSVLERPCFAMNFSQDVTQLLALMENHCP